VDQAFDALLQLDERAIVGDADHPAGHVRATDSVLGVEPGVRRELLEASETRCLSLSNFRTFTWIWSPRSRDRAGG